MLNFKSQSQKLWPVGRGHRRRRRTTLKMPPYAKSHPYVKNASLCEITSLCPVKRRKVKEMVTTKFCYQNRFAMAFGHRCAIWKRD